MTSAICSLSIIISTSLAMHLTPKRTRKIWGSIASIIVGISLFSCWSAINSTSHFISPFRTLQAQVANVFQNDKDCLVLSEESNDRMNLYGILSLCHTVPRSTRLLWLDHPDTLNLPPDVNHFYLYKCSPPVKYLVQSYGYRLTPVLKDWTVLKAEPESE
jgi:hypothetical protein